MPKSAEAGAGLLLCAALGSLAYWLGTVPAVRDQLHVGSLLIVLLLGMAWRTWLPIPEPWQAGITFAQKPVLRWAVAGLGFKLSLQELALVGGPALAVVAVCTVFAYFVGVWVARRLGVGEKLAVLLGVGGSICGASAIVAADSVVQSEPAETACALGTITLLGTLGIVAFPLIGRAIGMDEFTFSVWNGASLHEMAQVVAAGQTYGPDAEKWSAVVKLARITLLAPMVLALGWSWHRRSPSSGEARVAPVPWFLVAFLLFAAAVSTGRIPVSAVEAIRAADLWLLCLGMAGVGLRSGWQDVRAAGARPVLAGTVQWVVLSAAALGMALAIRPAP